MQEDYSTIMPIITAATLVTIIPSDPDGDSIGTSLALYQWLANQSIDVQIRSYYSLESINASDFSEGMLSKIKDYADFEPGPEDVVILLDGGSWSQFFGEDSTEKVNELTASGAKLMFFDHHDNHQLPIDKFSVAINEPKAAATAHVVFKHLIKENAAACTEQVANLLMFALFADTGRLAWQTSPETYRFAADLIELGADNRKAANYSNDWQDFEFFVEALPFVQKIPTVRLQICSFDLEHYQKLTKSKGAEFWQHADFFKNQVGKTSDGFDHLVLLREVEPNQVKINWRSRDFGVATQLLMVLKELGASVGGHESAGGGMWSGNISNLQEQLIASLTAKINAH